MLNEAVKEAKGIAPAEKFDTSVDVETNAFIPSTYIANELQKLDIYKRIAGVETMEESEEMLEELIDRFGEPPKSVQNLLTIARLKAKAHSVYVSDIVQKGNELKLTMYEKAKVDPAKIPGLLEAYAPFLKFTMDTKNPYFSYMLKGNSREKTQDVLVILEKLLSDMQIKILLDGEKSTII